MTIEWMSVSARSPRHTDVLAEISGNVAQVEVIQTFEAVYVFPLPDRAAVNDMEIRVGDRTIKGLIKRREEARNRQVQTRNGELPRENWS